MGTKPTAVQKSLQQQSHSVARNIADLERKAAEDEEYAKRLDAALNTTDIAAKPAAVEAPPAAVDESSPIMKRVNYPVLRKGKRGRPRNAPSWLGKLTKVMADGTSLRQASFILGLHFTKRDCERIYSMEEFKRLLRLERYRYWQNCGKLPSHPESRRRVTG